VKEVSSNAKRWFKEPLLHFLLAGGLLFATYTWLNHGVGDEPQVVHISSSEIDWLKKTWTRQWQRAPDQEELRGLVTNYLKEQLLAREARKLGLEDNDTIVRRRLAQKMEFLVQDTANLAEPVEGELLKFYNDNRARYQTPARISFTQIYFKTEAAARRSLMEIGSLPPDDLGDRTLLEREFSTIDRQELTSLFGAKFADAIFSLEPGSWQGPVASGYGFHLVRIGERQTAQQRPFDKVRDLVVDDWHREQQVKVSEKLFAGLLKKYDVVVDDNVKTLIGPLAEITQ
jgi:parvulin-like peptidyl-prolyl isomerase